MEAPEFKMRREALYRAHLLLRAPNPTEYAAKRKYGPNSLVMVYAGAMVPYLATECTAVAEAKADIDVSARFGWKTLRQISDESFEKLRADLAK